MFDHVKIGVRDYAASKAFYLQALAPLGVRPVGEGEPSYGIELCRPDDTVSFILFEAKEKPAHLHIAFAAASREQVDAFYRAAIGAGARDNGSPGLRPRYHANYYAAFVIDPDGHNIEAVCHAAAGTRGGHDRAMNQRLGLVSLVVRDYEEALAFFVGKLGFRLIEDSDVPEQKKRWVVVAPPGDRGANLLLARASSSEQSAHVGNQTGGRVFLFLYTDDFQRDYDRYRANGVEFVREPKAEPYGTVAVFKDLYGNLWDLVQPSGQAN